RRGPLLPPAGRHRRQRAPAVRLPLPPALPARDRPLQGPGAGDADRPRPPGRLPPGRGDRPVIPTIVRRLLAIVPTVVVATVVVFALVQITPGGAAEAAAGPTATPQQVQALKLQMGLDKPVPEQYGTWLWNLAHGDLGQSL